MKRLIVNADDWGLTPGVNRGIVRAFQHGIVTSASLLVTGSAFEDAVALARDFPALDVGLHLALVEEQAVLPPEALPTLVDKTGRLPRTKGEFFKRALLGRISWDEVEREIAGQIARFQQTGLRLSHLDSHQHLHMFPPVFQICDPPDPWDGSRLDSQLCWPLAKIARRPNGTMVPTAGFEFGVFVGARIV